MKCIDIHKPYTNTNTYSRLGQIYHYVLIVHIVIYICTHTHTHIYIYILYQGAPFCLWAGYNRSRALLWIVIAEYCQHPNRDKSIMVVFALVRQSLDITTWQGNMSRHLFHVQEYMHDSYNILAKMETTKFSSVWFVIQLSTYVTLGPLYVVFTFLSRMINRGVLGFANDCHCSAWCRGLTTCLLYVGPFLEI